MQKQNKMKTKIEVLAKADKKAEAQKVDKATLLKVLKKGSEKNAVERKTSTKEKNFLYKYQLDKKENALPEKEQKKKRSKLRRKLQNLVNVIILANVKKPSTEGVKEFLDFYKANYILNDFTLQSITASNDELKTKDLQKVLEICKKTK